MNCSQLHELGVELGPGGVHSCTSCKCEASRPLIPVVHQGFMAGGWNRGVKLELVPGTVL